MELGFMVVLFFKFGVIVLAVWVFGLLTLAYHNKRPDY
jgi:hypothetical protein